MATSDESFERLLENARWVRALGVELVGAGEADDLVQEAWVVALQGGARAENPAAWFAGVLRRLAGRGRRGTERRLRREAATARPEAVPGPDELVAEAELTRELIRAVTELEEPFRSTVLLRYSRGLEPDEIARQEGVPAATVRTRLHRAHEKLRTRLDRTHGGRPAWALAFVGPGALEGATGAVTWTGGLMATKTGIAAALAVVVGVGAWWRFGASGEGGAPLARAGADEGRSSVVAPLQGASGVAVRAGEREVPGAWGAAEAAFDDLLLYGSVLDTEGKPVELEGVGFEDSSGHAYSAWKPGAGSYALAGIRPGAVTLTLRALGFLPHVEELQLTGEREHVRNDVVLTRGLSIPFRVIDENGKRVTSLDPERHLELEIALTRGDRPALDSRERSARSRRLGEVVWAQDERAGHLAEGASGLLRLAVQPPVDVHACFEGIVFDSVHLDGPLEELVLHIDRAEFERGLGTVRCRFVDAGSGAALTDGTAGVDWANRYSHGGTPLGPDGRVELTRVPAGLQRLRYFGREREDLTRSIQIPPGGVLELGDVRVWPRARVRGRLIGADGSPAQGTVRWVCEAEGVRAEDLRGGVLHSTSGGRFDLDGVAATRIRLLARIGDHAPLAFVVDASRGGVEGLELRFEEGVPVRLRGVEGRALTLLDGAFGPWLPLEFDSLRLPTGRHTLELGSGAEARRIELVVGTEPLTVDLSEGD